MSGYWGKNCAGGPSELTVSQFVSLRFASDDELPLLLRKVLDEKNWTDGKPSSS